MLHPNLWRLWRLSLLALAGRVLPLRCRRLRLSLRFLLLRLLIIFFEVHLDHIESLFPRFFVESTLRKDLSNRRLGIVDLFRFWRLPLLLSWPPGDGLLQWISFDILDIIHEYIINRVLLVIVETFVYFLQLCLLLLIRFAGRQLTVRRPAID